MSNLFCMRNLICVLFSFVLTLSAIADNKNTAIAKAALTTAPVTFDNLYKAKLYGFNVTVTNRLTNLGNNQYDLLFKAESMIGSVTETSRMQWLADKKTIQPLHYVYKRRGLGKKRDADLSFNWLEKSVLNNVDNSRWQMNIVDQVQDKLSYQVQLAQELRAGKKQFTYQIADGGELKEYSFEVLGEELLETPLGKVNTIKVKRSRSNNKRVTYAWIAPGWDYLLVRLQQEEGGKSYTIYITQAKINGKTIEKF